ncbi:MAG: DUF1499 domain-containing protein [Alphaproteobacteria bacterium]|nr:DUF1499 domain-containing protein [Alphaproteobacteria bacterium]
MDESITPHPFFLGLARPPSPNSWLVAPEGFPGEADEPAPVFAVPVDVLRRALEEATAALGSVREVRREGELVCFVDETPLLRFTDDICVQLIALGPARATLAAYSASRVGYWDLGTNRRRLRRWLRLLAVRVNAI